MGASTRNAGFACFGSFGEIREDIENMGMDAAVQLIENRVKGLELHKSRLGEEKMGYVPSGGGEFLFKDETLEEGELQAMNAQLKPILKKEVFFKDPDAVSRLGFNPEPIQHFIGNRCEGQVDTGKFMLNLWLYASQLGVLIMNGMEVLDYEDHGSGCNLFALHNQIKAPVEFKCETLIFCTNAFSQRFIKDLDCIPGRGQILVTKPIPHLKMKGIYHFAKGYYYFRDFESRIIFGGGRNLDIEGETTEEIAINDTIQDSLKHYLTELILPGVDYEIESQWAGIMAFGKEKNPIIERVSGHVIAGIRMGGMGIALSGITATKIADMI